MSSRGMFTGRCYLCGVVCGRTYCQEHKWAATHLAMPYRRDHIHTPTLEEVVRLVEELNTANRTIAKQERTLQAWRRRSRIRLVKAA